ncbi:MAG TPA: hypothetical protein VLI41_06680 [Phenylobacterium sp.]|uniref:hypothetical protein n=1 Tax=Phenylobacterium sp. TaxID=1871053 RepID=UPI002C0A31C0|nr:hypothetical protein [Phenylobacterium sp.]HSV02875.1 hypothetical protein [Phenylobacterium sp.]
MPLPSYSDVFKLDHQRPHDEDIRAGDTVRMGANFHPHYAVIAVHGDKAWVRNVQTGEDHLAELTRCRKVAHEALAFAAE